MKVSDHDYEEALTFLKTKFPQPQPEVERWLNSIVDAWVSRPRAGGRMRTGGRSGDGQEVKSLLARLEPNPAERVVLASRLSPETLPDEIMLLESVAVLSRELSKSHLVD